MRKGGGSRSSFSSSRSSSRSSSWSSTRSGSSRPSRPMTPREKAACLAFFQVIMLVGSAWMFVSSLSAATTERIELAPLETRTLFSNGESVKELLVKASAWPSKVQLLLFSSKPTQLKEIPIEVADRVDVRSGRYEYWARILHDGSKVDVELKLNAPAKFYMIRGEKNFKKWQKSPAESVIHYKESSLRNKRLEFPVSHTDDYYFIVESEDSVPTSGNILFSITAMVIDETFASERFRAEESGGVIRVHAETRVDHSKEKRVLQRAPVAVLWNAEKKKIVTLTVTTSHFGASLSRLQLLSVVIFSIFALWLAYPFIRNWQQQQINNQAEPAAAQILNANSNVAVAGRIPGIDVVVSPAAMAAVPHDPLPADSPAFIPTKLKQKHSSEIDD